MSAADGRRRVRSRQLVGVLAGLTVLVLNSPGAADGAVVAAPAFAGVAALTGSSAELAGVVFEGVATVQTATGTVETIKLTTTAAAITDLRLRPPCTPISGLGAGMTTESTTPGQSISRAPAGMTVYATALTASTPTGSVTWTAANPPPARQLGDLSLAELSVQLVSLRAPEIVLPGLHQASLYCAS
ncbi:MAG TPA: hypothetical protein VLC50_03800 [Actinomycetes bacterium]|nr:hypothetical protein [Actinomycetes bacterium]